MGHRREEEQREGEGERRYEGEKGERMIAEMYLFIILIVNSKLSVFIDRGRVDIARCARVCGGELELN
jgi:hypothetical protein